MSTKIVFVLPSLLGGGAEFVATNWARELQRRGSQVEIVLLRARKGEPDVGVPVRQLASQGAGRIAEFRASRQLLATESVDTIIISLMTRANFQILVSAIGMHRRPKIVISERNIPRREPGQGLFHLAIRDTLFALLYRRADAFLAISHAVGAYFRSAGRVQQGKTWVIPNPALAKRAMPTRDVPISPRGKALDIVVPARLVDAKRPLLALETAKILTARGHTVRLRYFGAGEMEDVIRSEAGSFPVSLPGRVEDWFMHLGPDSIVLLTSQVEGFANVLLEAAAAGAPVVVGSTAYGSSDAVIPGISGEFARTDHVDEYVRAVEAAARIEGTVPVGWLSTFSLEESADRLKQMIDSLNSRIGG